MIPDLRPLVGPSARPHGVIDRRVDTGDGGSTRDSLASSNVCLSWKDAASVVRRENPASVVRWDRRRFGRADPFDIYVPLASVVVQPV
jgi:hypothetical protein